MKYSEQSIQELLEAAHFTEGLSSEIISGLAHHARLLRVEAGTVLFAEGEFEDEIFVMLSGRAALEMAVPGRGRVRLLTVGPGELLGWSGLVDEGVMTATALVISEAQLIGLSSSRLLQLSESDHHFGYRLMRQTAMAVSRRLVATRLQLLDLYADMEPESDQDVK